MMKPKAGPVLGGIVALIALVGLGVKLVSPSASTGALERRVDEFFAREREQAPEARFQNVPQRLEELQGLQDDPHFGEIPARQQDLVKQRMRELNLYVDFAAGADHIADPKDADSEEQLAALKKRVELLKIPDEYRTAWRETNAGRRYRTIVEDIAAIEKAAEELRSGYRAAATEGEAVLRDRNAPRLPQRAKAVLDRAARLPIPVKDSDKRLPGSERLTYAVVFRFPSVAEAMRAWEKVRDRLKPLAVE
jgi:hypothetical protein